MRYIIIILLFFSLTVISCKQVVKEVSEQTLKKTKTQITNLLPKKEIKKIISKISTTAVPRLDPKRPYNRLLINKQFKKVKTQLHGEAIEQGSKQKPKRAFFIDSYTGKKLYGGDPYEFDHLRSAQTIFNKYKAILTDEEIAKVVNCKENIVAVSTKINRAKGKWDLEYLLKNEQKVKDLNINIDLAKQSALKADIAIKRNIQQIITNR